MTTRRRLPRQTSIPYPFGWGGRRQGAGRKPSGKHAGVPHRRRPVLSGREPVHVTVRMGAEVWNLRSRRGFGVVGRALGAAADRFGLRVCAFCVQGNHLHLVCEATDRRALWRGMQGLGVRLARGMNRLMGRRGRVLRDRYHEHVLRTPAETRRSLAYVLGNHNRHASRWGRPTALLGPGRPDPFSSAVQGHGVALPAPRTWLLGKASRERGEPAPS